MPAPVRPSIFHIVHIDKLASIVSDGGLISDALVIEFNRAGSVIGLPDIKRRRLQQLKLSCHPEVYVGQCVPFYFCPRSVMLYLIYMANHPGLQYRGGQAPIVHLELDLHEAVQWAESKDRRWAFTLSNAGATYTEHYCDISMLDELNWTAIGARDWRAPEIKEAKQSEFLVEQSIPWHLVKRIGTSSMQYARQAAEIIRQAGHRPSVEAKAEWYY